MVSSRRPDRSTKRTARIMVGLIGLFVVGLLAVWWRLASDVPVVTIPNPVMPNPNAFDFYVAAGNAVNTMQIDDINASKPRVQMTLKQKAAAVQRNAAAIQSLHQGFAYEYCNPPVRSFYLPLPYFTASRKIARVLAAQSRVRAEQGDWAGAADSALDAIRLGEDIPRGGSMMADLVGIACQSIGQRPLWKTVEHLNATQGRAAARRLEAIVERHFPYAETIQEEKWFGQAGFQEMFRTVNVRNALAKAKDVTGSDAPASESYSTALYLLYGKKRILQNYTETMDATAAQARQPYAARLPLPPVPADPINKNLFPVFENARFIDLQAETQNGLLLVTLALQAYRLEHGHYPASLAELAPSYLKRLPDDPFALRGTFQYRREGQKMVLYSIGPDGKDDHGTPTDNPKNASAASPYARYRVEKESQGDIVGGINIQ